MTSAEQTGGNNDKSCKSCDLTEIDNLACEAVKIEKQAEVTKESLEKLTTYRNTYDEARAKYTQALATARADVESANKDLDPVHRDLDCRLDDKNKRDCLISEWGTVKQDIVKCTGPTGCLIGECKPDTSVGDKESQASLAGRIQELRQKSTEYGAYFDALIQEQAGLTDRAAAAKAAVSELEEDVKDKDRDPFALYARSLVARWLLDNVENGFRGVEDYLDCLCRTLTCVHRAWQAIVTLEGVKAEMACKEDADKKKCAALQSDPVAETLARFTRNCEKGSAERSKDELSVAP